VPQRRPTLSKDEGGSVLHEELMGEEAFDVVGWDGCLSPYAFAIENCMPITGKVHEPPPSHQASEGHSSVTCHFVPRKVDHHEPAV